MRNLSIFFRFFLRFRYPVSLPEDIADALGVNFSNYLTFEELFVRLTSPDCCPKRLMRFMPREQAEKAFVTAQRKERFAQNTLFSFYFNEGWLEFSLHFDNDARLRRMYIQHKKIKQHRGVEIPLMLHDRYT